MRLRRVLASAAAETVSPCAHWTGGLGGSRIGQGATRRDSSFGTGAAECKFPPRQGTASEALVAWSAPDTEESQGL